MCSYFIYSNYYEVRVTYYRYLISLNRLSPYRESSEVSLSCTLHDPSSLLYLGWWRTYNYYETYTCLLELMNKTLFLQVCLYPLRYYDRTLPVRPLSTFVDDNRCPNNQVEITEFQSGLLVNPFFFFRIQSYL